MGVWAVFLASSMPTGTRTRQTGAATRPKQNAPVYATESTAGEELIDTQKNDL